MDRQISLQTYVPRAISAWVRERARERRVSVSVAVRDMLVDAWNTENIAADKSAGLDPDRQNLFITVALDALLAGHSDPQLRRKTHDAYHRKLTRLGLAATPVPGGEDEA